MYLWLIPTRQNIRPRSISFPLHFLYFLFLFLFFSFYFYFMFSAWVTARRRKNFKDSKGEKGRNWGKGRGQEKGKGKEREKEKPKKKKKEEEEAQPAPPEVLFLYLSTKYLVLTLTSVVPLTNTHINYSHHITSHHFTSFHSTLTCFISTFLPEHTVRQRHYTILWLALTLTSDYTSAIRLPTLTSRSEEKSSHPIHRLKSIIYHHKYEAYTSSTAQSQL